MILQEKFAYYTQYFFKLYYKYATLY